MSTRTLIRVGDVMRREPSKVDGMATAEEALALMSARSISSLVVNRRDDDDEFGLVLISDIAREIIGRGRPLARTNVYEIMMKPAPMVAAEMNIKYAIRYMSSCRFTHCLVLRGRELAGVVTLRDMAIRYIESTETTRGA
jgi:CBS domain-containing protein